MVKKLTKTISIIYSILSKLKTIINLMIYSVLQCQYIQIIYKFVNNNNLLLYKYGNLKINYCIGNFILIQSVSYIE